MDAVGRGVDFSVLKDTLCEWLERNWDHKLLIWDKDPWLAQLQAIDSSVVAVSFNPTAENMAKFLVQSIGPNYLKQYTGVKLVNVIVHETRKCSAGFGLDQ